MRKNAYYNLTKTEYEREEKIRSEGCGEKKAKGYASNAAKAIKVKRTGMAMANAREKYIKDFN